MQRPVWELGPPVGSLTSYSQESCGNAEAISGLPATSQVLLLRAKLWEQWLLWVLQQERQQVSAHLTKQPPSI